MQPFFLGLLIVAFASLGFTMTVETTRLDQQVTISFDAQFPLQGLGKTDVLFVIDDSGSMSTHQESLSNHIGLMVDEAVKSKNGFHIGIINTGFNNTSQPTGLLLGSPSVIMPTTPNLELTLANNLMLGTEGSASEAVFEPVIQALTGGHNPGFYRDDAKLAVVVLTDAEDQSHWSAQNFVTVLTQLKGDPGKVIFQSILGDNSINCSDELQDPLKIIEATHLLNGDVYSLCSENYAADIKNIGQKVFADDADPNYGPGIDLDEVTILGTPVVGSIEVRVGTQTIEEDSQAGWAYIQSRNVIKFGPQIQWTPQNGNPEIQISYSVN